MQETENKKSGRFKFVILLLFIVAAFASIKFLDLGRYINEEQLRAWIEAAGIWGPLVYIAIYSVAPSLLLPGLPITVAGGVLFGPFWGVVYTAIGASIGACLAFLIARYMGRDWVKSRIKGTRLKELDEKVQTQGWKIVAFTRLIPAFPFNLLNYAFGLTRIKFSHYAIATFVFMLPGITAYVVFSSSLVDIFEGRITKKFLAGLVLIVLISVIPLIYRKTKRKTLQTGNSNADEPEAGTTRNGRNPSEKEK